MSFAGLSIMRPCCDDGEGNVLLSNVSSQYFCQHVPPTCFSAPPLRQVGAGRQRGWCRSGPAETPGGWALRKWVPVKNRDSGQTLEQLLPRPCQKHKEGFPLIITMRTWWAPPKAGSPGISLSPASPCSAPSIAQAPFAVPTSVAAATVFAG